MEISLEKGLFPRSHPNFLEMLLKSKLSCLKRDLLSRLMKIYNLKIYFRFIWIQALRGFYSQGGYLAKTSLYNPDIEFSFAGRDRTKFVFQRVLFIVVMVISISIIINEITFWQIPAQSTSKWWKFYTDCKNSKYLWSPKNWVETP